MVMIVGSARTVLLRKRLVGEDLEDSPAGGIAEGGIDGICRDQLSWRHRRV